MKSQPTSIGERNPSMIVSLVILVVATAFMAYLRLFLFRNQFITLAYGLPLLICLWHKDRRLLWSMAATFVGMATLKAFWLKPWAEYCHDLSAVDQAERNSSLTPRPVRVWVEDNGVGIPIHSQSDIFSLFHRGTVDCEGTGLGLAIVKKVVERMGGNVGVESAPGHGSRFWVDLLLPRHSAPAPATPLLPSKPPEKPLL